MYAMHVLFDLKPGVGVDEVEAAFGAFTAHLQALDLVVETTPVARRDRHPVLDTDHARGHGWFASMRFRDRAQADRAVARISEAHGDTLALHRAAFALVADPVFFCTQDAGPA
ncbi:MAG: hypothetical protein AAFZ09_08560 [Pseudomonadota bacterium]